MTKLEAKQMMQTTKTAPPQSSNITSSPYEKKDVFNPKSIGIYNNVTPLPAKTPSYVDEKELLMIKRMNELETSLKVANNTIALNQSFEVKASTIKEEFICMFKEASGMISDSTRLGASLATEHSTRMGDAIAGIVKAVARPPPSSPVVSLSSTQPAPQPSDHHSISSQPITQPLPNLMQQVPLLPCQQHAQQYYSPQYYPPTSQWGHVQSPFMQQQYNYFNYQHSPNQQQQFQQQQMMMMQQGFLTTNLGYPPNIHQMPMMPAIPMPAALTMLPTPSSPNNMMLPPNSTAQQLLPPTSSTQPYPYNCAV